MSTFASEPGTAGALARILTVMLCLSCLPSLAEDNPDYWSLHNQALSAETSGNKKDAEHLIQDAVTRAQSTGNLLDETFMLDAQARLLDKHGKRLESESILKQCEKNYRKLLTDSAGDSTKNGALLPVVSQKLADDIVFHATVLTALNRVPEALSLYSQTLAAKDSWLKLFAVRSQLTNEYVRLLRKNRQTDLSNQLELNQEASEFDEVKWDHYFKEAITLVKSNQNQTAIHELKALLAATGHLNGVPWRRANCLRWLGEAYLNEGDLSHASESAHNAITILLAAREEPVHKEVATPYCILSEVFLRQKDYADALKYAQQAHELFLEQQRANPNQEGLADSLSRAARDIAAAKREQTLGSVPRP